MFTAHKLRKEDWFYKMFLKKKSTSMQLFVSSDRLIVENYKKTETK